MRTTDIAIIGAGPAGLAAALAAAEAGRRVTLIDENASAGGSLQWSIADVAGGSTPGYLVAQQLADQVAGAGVELALQSVAWGLFEDRVITVSDAQHSYRLQSEAIILATGATDITIPFPGWELPGVMTATAFLRAVVLHRVVPGRAIVIVGHGLEAQAVRSTCETLGLGVVAEARTTSDVQVFGQESVTHVSVDARQVPADVVVLAIGRRPDPELALHGLCAIGYAESSLSQVPRRTETLMISITGVYAVGDCAGLCSLEEAFAEGRVAGYAASGSARLNDALASLAATRSARRAAELQSLLLDEARRTLGGGNGA